MEKGWLGVLLNGLLRMVTAGVTGLGAYQIRYPEGRSSRGRMGAIDGHKKKPIRVEGRAREEEPGGRLR